VLPEVVKQFVRKSTRLSRFPWEGAFRSRTIDASQLLGEEMSKQPRKHDDLFQDEAERLAQLPHSDQAAVVAMYRKLADSPQATPACRAESKANAKALEKLLGLHKRPANALGKPSAKPRRQR
jgi:hypothetical protein